MAEDRHAVYQLRMSNQTAEQRRAAAIDATVRRFTIDVGLMMLTGFCFMVAMLSLLLSLD
jgi:hypothetical protein